jgi:hypothetical protein
VLSFVNIVQAMKYRSAKSSDIDETEDWFPCTVPLVRLRIVIFICAYVICLRLPPIS